MTKVDWNLYKWIVVDLCHATYRLHLSKNQGPKLNQGSNAPDDATHLKH